MEKPRVARTVAIPPIERGKLYRLPEFMRLAGMGKWAMRTARKNGLKVRYIGGNGFVLADDFLQYLDKCDRENSAA